MNLGVVVGCERGESGHVVGSERMNLDVVVGCERGEY